MTLNKHEYAVRTWLTDDFKVIQEVGDPTGEMTRRVANVAAAQADAKFREGLIALGWAPPEEAKNMVDIDRVLAMMGAGATLQELCDWLLELKR